MTKKERVFCCDKQEGGFKDGQPWFGKQHVGKCAQYDSKCQYCGIVTGTVTFKWATEDVCFGCTYT